MIGFTSCDQCAVLKNLVNNIQNIYNLGKDWWNLVCFQVGCCWNSSCQGEGHVSDPKFNLNFCMLLPINQIGLHISVHLMHVSEKKQWCWRINMQFCFSCVTDWQKFWTFQKLSGHWAKITYFCTKPEKWSLTKAKIWLNAEMSFASHNLG